MNPAGNRIRVLLVSLYTQFGGGEYGFYYLMKYLDRKKFEPYLVTNQKGPLVEKAESLGIECFIIPFKVVMLQHLIKPSVFLQNFKSAFALRKLIVEKNIDLVQCQDVLSLILLLPTSLTRRIRIVYNVIFFHEDLRVFLLDCLSFLKVKFIPVLSKKIRDDVVKKSLFLKKKLRLIYWGVDFNRFYPRSENEKSNIKSRLGLPPDKRIVGFIGRYDVWKGHLTFINACREVLNRRGDVMLLIAGGSMTADVVPAVAKYRSEVENVMQKFIQDGDLIVWDHRDDVPEVMSVLDVFVCPSDREPFGLVVLEALACGIPSVVSDGVGALEVVGGLRGVFEANAGDADSFASAIEEALKFKSEQMDTRLLIERFSWEIYAKQYENLYFESF